MNNQELRNNDAHAVSINEKIGYLRFTQLRIEEELTQLHIQIRSLKEKETRTEGEEINLKALYNREKALVINLQRVREELDDSEAIARATNAVKQISENVQSNLQTLSEQNRGNEAIQRLQDQVTELVELNTRLVKLQARQPMSKFAPVLSVITPKVKFVDANLAYKYADAQGDANTYISFTTLFLGALISTIASLIVSFQVPTDRLVLAVYWSITAMALLISVIFGVLSIRAYLKAKAAKVELENDAGEKIIDLSIVVGTTEQTDVQ